MNKVVDELIGYDELIWYNDEPIQYKDRTAFFICRRIGATNRYPIGTIFGSLNLMYKRRIPDRMVEFLFLSPGLVISGD